MQILQTACAALVAVAVATGNSSDPKTGLP